jgi:hypothetical protein
VAYGWTGGSYFENANLLIFRAREAHAWTEVLVQDVGWVILDCTPVSSIGAGRTAPREERPFAESSDKTDDPMEQPLSSRPPYLNHAIIAVIVASAVLLWILSRTKKTSSAGLASTRSQSPFSRKYYQAFRKYCEQAGVRVMPADTIRKLIARLPHKPSWAESLQRYHYGIRYGKKSTDASTEDTLHSACEKHAP